MYPNVSVTFPWTETHVGELSIFKRVSVAFPKRKLMEHVSVTFLLTESMDVNFDYFYASFFYKFPL